jgi:hypothetical protein
LSINVQTPEHLDRAYVHFREREPLLAEVFQGSAEMIDGSAVNYDKAIMRKSRIK